MNRLSRVLVLSLVLFGCVAPNVQRQADLTPINQVLQAHTNQSVALIVNEDQQQQVTARVQTLLAAPLTVENAVQIALLNNKDLQAILHEVGVSTADYVQASLLPNPRLSVLYTKHADQFTIEQTLSFNLLAFLTRPMVKEISQQKLQYTQQQATLSVLNLITHTRQSYFQAVARQQYLQYIENLNTLMLTSKDLAVDMQRVGNASRLSRARYQVMYAEWQAEYEQAKLNALMAREKLIRQLGLTTDSHLDLPDVLPDLPDTLAETDDVEATAMKQRIDIQAMQTDVDQLAQQLGLTKKTRFINVLNIGPARTLEGTRAEPSRHGIVVSVDLPLFDFGNAKVQRAQAIYMQAINRASQRAIQAHSEVRQAYANVRTRYAIAQRYRDEILPWRKIVLSESVLRHNAMLISVFDLIDEAKNQSLSFNRYVESVQDFWLAQTTLEMVMLGPYTAKE